MTSLNEQKFNNKAKNYDIGRPQYATAAIDFVFKHFFDRQLCYVAEIGSGTGIFAEQLLRKSKENHARIDVVRPRGVIAWYNAVEPNDEMRAVAEEKLSKYAVFHSIKGTAENTNLGNGQVETIFVAQAFHWFDKAKFKIECERIQKYAGNDVVLFWNRKDYEQDITKEINVVYEKYCTAYKGHRGGGDLKQIESEIASFYNDEVDTVTFDNDLEYDQSGFVQMNLSQSYSLVESDKNYQKFIDEIVAVFNKYQNNGKVKISNKTQIYWRYEFRYGCLGGR